MLGLVLLLILCDYSIDNQLGAFLEHYAAAADSYTVIYAGGPRTEKPQTYTAEFTNTGVDHSELKRQLDVVARSKRQETGNKNLPLFEKYQFFTPGKSIYPAASIHRVFFVCILSVLLCRFCTCLESMRE